MWESIAQKNTYCNLNFGFCLFSALGIKRHFFLCSVLLDMETEINICTRFAYTCVIDTHYLIQKYNSNNKKSRRESQLYRKTKL